MDFVIITIYDISSFFSVAARRIRNICILKAKIIVLKRQILRELSGPSSSSSSPEERRVYTRWSNDEEAMLLRLWAENFDRRFYAKCHDRDMLFT